MIRWRVACGFGATVGTALLVAAPWLWQPLVPAGWAGVALGLAFVSGRRGWRAELTVLAACSLAITLAFHWTPHALAGAMRASPIIGFVFAMPIILWDACRLALPFWVAGRMTTDPRMAWLPAALTAVVAERFMPAVFPWKLGYSQLAWPVTVQTASLVGAEGPTFTLFAIAGALLTGASLAVGPRSRGRVPALALVAAGVTAINLLFGIAAMRMVQTDMAASPSIRLALVQADPNGDGGVEALRRMTREVCATQRPPDLVVWPECSGGSYEEGLDSFADDATVFRRSRDPRRGLRPLPEPPCPILLGGRIYRGFRERPDSTYQAALLVDSDERLAGSYLKRHLMPFGEYVPWADVIPELRLYFPMETRYDRGHQATVIESGKARIGPLLCYEDMVPSAAASLVERSANVLVALVHGAAFANPLTLQQHRLLAQSRAIENRRMLARASSTGETCLIDATGRITARLPLKTEGVLVADVPLLDGMTPAHSLGPLFPIVCGMTLALLASGKLRRMVGLAEVATT